jgi:hypothetical protein
VRTAVEAVMNVRADAGFGVSRNSGIIGKQNPSTCRHAAAIFQCIARSPRTEDAPL